jgi:hypothetical protein
MIVLPATNADDILKIFGFLKECRIPFHIPSEHVGPIMDIMKHHNLELYTDILTGTPLEELCIPKKYEQKLLKPSSNLKHFCGSEWVIGGKYVTEEILFQRIDQYAIINKLKNGMYFQLDEILRNVLCTDKLIVNDFELRNLFHSITCSS